MPTTSTFAKHWKSGRFSNLKWPDKIQVQITTLDSLIKKYPVSLLPELFFLAH